MNTTLLRRTIYQVLNYSSHSEKEHHFVVIGIGVFDVNETKQDSNLEVDVWLKTNAGKRIWITYQNLDLVLNELIHQPA